MYTRVGARQGEPANSVLVRAMDKYTPIVANLVKNKIYMYIHTYIYNYI